MVAAAEQLTVSTSGRGVAGAMAADVMKASERSIFAASNEERLSHEVESEIVSGVGGLVNVTYQLPGSSEEPSLFVLKGLWTEIKRCRQGRSASDVLINCTCGMEWEMGHRRSS